MKKAFTFVLIALFLGIAMSFTGTTVHAVPVAGEECDNATTEITITTETGIKFETGKIEVPRATCVKITLINLDDAIEHDFTIEGKTDIEEVYIPVGPSETNSFNVTTPDLDITFEFYCSVVGHKAQGMVGDFVVGEGSADDDSPGFGLWLSIGAFLVLITVVPRFRK